MPLPLRSPPTASTDDARANFLPTTACHYRDPARGSVASIAATLASLRWTS